MAAVPAPQFGAARIYEMPKSSSPRDWSPEFSAVVRSADRPWPQPCQRCPCWPGRGRSPVRTRATGRRAGVRSPAQVRYASGLGRMPHRGSRIARAVLAASRFTRRSRSSAVRCAFGTVHAAISNCPVSPVAEPEIPVVESVDSLQGAIVDRGSVAAVRAALRLRRRRIPGDGDSPARPRTAAARREACSGR